MNRNREDTTISSQTPTAFITGAASGLGRQLAFDLASKGSRLFLIDVDEAALRETVQTLKQSDVSVRSMRVDVTDAEECRSAIASAIAEFGRIDSLILCAGISMWARFEDVSDLSIFRRLMEINYLGAVHCIHPALSHLRERNGTIVTISSLQAVLGIPNHTGYAASKKALNGFLDSLKFEVGDDVHFLNVMPGWISGTNLRSNAFTADGNRHSTARKHSKESVSVEESSRLILEALASGKKELYIPSKLRFIPWAKLIAPGWLHRRIQKEVEKQKKQ